MQCLYTLCIRTKNSCQRFPAVCTSPANETMMGENRPQDAHDRQSNTRNEFILSWAEV